jgi:diacylglycerol kinase (ATP)
MLEFHWLASPLETVSAFRLMRKAFLIYNPASGRRRRQRAEAVAQVAAVFRDHGIQLEAAATTHGGSAIQQAKEAAEAGFDTVIACGGDGTANEVLNGVTASSAKVSVGIVPLGSGNLLAADLRLPGNPVAAAQKLLTYTPREFHPGIISSQHHGAPEKRYFIVAAGVGSDAELMYRTAVEAKERWGRNAYFLEMARMAVHGRYPMFHIEWEDEQGNRRQDSATLAMAIRATRFPGLLRFVNLGSALTRDSFCLLLFRTDKVRRFLSYFAGVATGMNWRVPEVDVIHSRWLRCMPLAPGSPIYSQADGELLGTVPAELSIESRTVQLLMP